MVNNIRGRWPLGAWATPTGKGPWGRSGEVGTFCVLLGVWVTKMQPIGKTHQTVHVRSVPFTESELYLSFPRKKLETNTELQRLVSKLQCGVMGTEVWNLPGDASAGRWADRWVEGWRLRCINQRSQMVGVCRLTYFFQLSCVFGNFCNTTSG